MNRRGLCRAFSLIELIVVITVMAVVISVAIPRMASAARNSRVNAAKLSVREFTGYIESYYVDYGTWPVLRADDFVGSKQHVNPFAPSGAPVLDQPAALGATVFHPAIKVTTAGNGAAGWWYNRDSGAFRGRVSDRGTEDNTVTDYNDINGTQVSAAAQTAK